ISSSSAISSRSCCSCSVTCLLELCLQRVAVDAVVVAVELVDELVDLDDGVARDDPQRRRLPAATVLFARVNVGKIAIGSFDRAGVRERRALPLLTEDLEDHAASLAFGSLPRAKPCFAREPPPSEVFQSASAARMSPHAPTIKSEGTSRFPPSPSPPRVTFGVTQPVRARRCAPTPSSRVRVCVGRAGPASSARGR